MITCCARHCMRFIISHMTSQRVPNAKKSIELTFRPTRRGISRRELHMEIPQRGTTWAE